MNEDLIKPPMVAFYVAVLFGMQATAMSSAKPKTEEYLVIAAIGYATYKLDGLKAWLPLLAAGAYIYWNSQQKGQQAGALIP